MPQWLGGVISGIGVVVCVVLLIISLNDHRLRRSLKRRSERDDEIWYTTGSPMVRTQDLANHLED